jgi:cytochrome c nitrite reductase small subunit
VHVSSRLTIAAVVAVGLAVGLGAFTFGYAQGHSYLSNDPAACANCHIMTEHFDAWRKSSHSAVATCNDCHTPHNFVGKYASKAQNGFWHSFYFTTGNYPDPLRITERNQQVTEAACRQCHAAITEAIDPHPVHAPLLAGAGDPHRGRASCVRCHTHVGHLVR